MITKNGKKLIAAAAFSPYADLSGKYYIPIKLPGGVTYYASLSSTGFPYYNNFKFEVANTSLYTGIRVGSGTTPPTEDDYNIQSQISYTVIDGSSSLYEYGVDSSGNPYVQIMISIKNKGTTNSFTVSEICYFGNAETKSTPNASGGMSSAVLIDRTLLDEPVTIAPGETAEILYTISCAIS